MDGEKNSLAPEKREKEETAPAVKAPAGKDSFANEKIGNRPEKADGRKEGFDFGRLLFGLLTVSFGLYLLGKSTGYISEDLHIDIFRFWPVLVVVAGLSLLDTRRPVSFVLALFAFAAVAAFMGVVVKDAVLKSGIDDGQILPVRMDGGWKWEMRGPISGSVEGV